MRLALGLLMELGFARREVRARVRVRVRVRARVTSAHGRKGPRRSISPSEKTEQGTRARCAELRVR